MKENWLKIFLKGLCVGGTMLVPGVSGGSMAMILGIYDKLITSVSSFFACKKRNALFLLLFALGGGAGMLLFANPLLYLLERYPQLEFSISATSRAPRGQERDGVDYYFLSQEEFMKAVAENRFVEWEEVYKGTCYGTLRSEVERIWAKGHVIVFDVDVIGGINLKRIFGDDACSVFVMPPSIEELRRRLVTRGTDAPEVIERRVAKAEFELTKAPEFDHVVVNDCLEEAVGGTCGILDQFIAR